MPELAVVKSWPLPSDLASSPSGGTAAPDILSLLDQKADQYGVPRNLVRTVTGMESSYNPNASSGKANGLMQLAPATAKSLGVTNVWDPEQNADGGVRLLSQLIDKYGGNTSHVLAAYNAGEPAVDRAGGVPNFPETQKYVAKGLKSLPPNLSTGGGSSRAPAAGAAPADNVLSRLATGDVTPDELAQYLQPAPAAAETPKAPPAPPAAPLAVVKSWPLPPPAAPPSAFDEAKRLGSIAAGASGLTAAKDVLANGAKTAMDFLTGNPVDPQNVQQFNSSLLALEHGVYGELPRSGQQIVESLKAVGRGDINAAADHLWFSIPFLGAAGEQMKAYLDRGDVKGALAHAAGSLAPVAAHPAIGATGRAIEALPGALEALPETVSRTVEATRAGVRAAAPDVAKGTLNVGVATGASYLPIPGPVKYGFGIPTAAAGAKQIVGGLRKGAAAARASFAETAPAVAPEVPGAGFAVPKEPPIAGPTDEALVHLYSVETDPVKRGALETQLVDRGLMNKPAEPGAPPQVAPEANPYRGYSQNALQKVYAIEPDVTKRALIEQAARDRNLTLLSREGRRATAAVPETGATEARGPSLTQDDALMLRYLGETDPSAATAETIGIARKLAVDNPELLRRLRAGETEPVVTAPTPADQAAIAQPAVQSVPAAMEYNAPTPAPPAAAPAQQPTPPQSPAPAAPTAAPAAPTAAPAAAPPTPGQAYAVSQGYDWAKLSAQDRELFEHIATAQENVATTPAPPPPAAPPPAATPPAPQSQSLADLMRGAPETDLEKQLADSIAAAKAGKQPEAGKQPAPETPAEALAPKPENVYIKNARLAKAVRVADAAQQKGLTSGAVYRMKPDDFARRVGEKSISADTMAMVVDKLRRREADAARVK